MTALAASRVLRSTHVVATGYTTALLGDERTLREFVVGDSVVQARRASGAPAVLILLNDTYDPLNARQLRVGLNKDASLIHRFTEFCGRPIAEIPDPYDCHASYADHFRDQLLDRLYALDIHPQILDVYGLYGQGAYAPFVEETLHRHDEIQRVIADALDDYAPAQLFRVQCSRCRRIDATRMSAVDGHTVRYRCEACGEDRQDAIETVRGKLSWKMDCAARWNLFGIGTEVFAKAHWADRSTLGVAEIVSRGFFGGHVPEIVRYGDMRLSPELSYRLLETLPPVLLKRLLTEHLARDLVLTPEAVEHFAETAEIRPGLCYGDYVSRELPLRVLEGMALPAPAAPHRPGLDPDTLLRHGLAYARHFHDRRHVVGWPDAERIEAATPDECRMARELIARAIEHRASDRSSRDQIVDALRAFLRSQPAAPGVYPLLRRLFHQVDGPRITTVLAVAPLEYLKHACGILERHHPGLDPSALRDLEPPDRAAA